MSNISDSLSLYFSNLQELEKWLLNKDDLPVTDIFRISREPLHNYSRTRETNDKTDVKIMVCHDFKGNYQIEEDENPLGYFPHSTGQHYFIQYPSLVDIFIYFSHHRVSIPPVSWINALHKQGIPVLGTLLIEGQQHRLLDDLVTRDPNDETKFKYVGPLVQLAKHYGFEGWLVNIESVFTLTSKVNDIILFVEQLKSEIHLEIPNSKIVWYDAFIAEKNRVFYQNGVNEHNYDHFESCDSLFTNYWWDENTLRQNILNVGLQGVKKKLYTGIDVWGRGSKIGNGGFDVGVALNFLRVYSSNAALFAPAWTYENFNNDEFISKDQQFWIDHNSANPGGSVATFIPFTTAPTYSSPDTESFIFYTNFSQGEGNGFNVNGVDVYDSKWVNASLQAPVPTGLKQEFIEVTKVDKYNGGSSIKLSLSQNVLIDNIELFNFRNEITSRSINVSISYKSHTKIPPNSEIKLLIRYYVERRYRTITRVKEGAFEIPLKFTRVWKTKSITLQLPKLQPREHFVLEKAEIQWKPEEHDDFIDQSWIYVPEEINKSTILTPKKTYEILIGDLLIESNQLRRSIIPIRRVISTTVVSEKDKTQSVLVQWNEQSEVLYWIIYVNSRFVSALNSPAWILERGDRLRVDCFTRSGQVVNGQEIVV